MMESYEALDDMAQPKYSFSSLWESDQMVRDELDSSVRPNVIDDDFEDDFLIISDNMEDDASLGLVEHEINGERVVVRENIIRLDAPATPPPDDAKDQEQSHLVREVTPDLRKDVVSMIIDDIRLPNLDELRTQYRFTCRKLAGTIWHAEMTRRWYAHQAHLGGIRQPDRAVGRAAQFLTGSRATLTDDLEYSRHRMWELIHSTENVEC